MSPNQPKTKQRGFRIPDALYTAAQTRAAEQGETLTDVVRRALERYVKAKGEAVSINLLTETREAISHSGHEINDIVLIGSIETGHSCTWRQFRRLADVEYDAGFGAAEVATDLVVVFADGSKLWRHEYDGSENWMFDAPVQLPSERLPVKRLVGAYWPKLAELQDDSDVHHLGSQP